MAVSKRAHFAISQQLVPGLINAGLNGWIAWGMHHDKVVLPLWGHDGYAGDLVATGVLLPGITWLILRPLLLKQAAAGKAPALDGIPPPWASRFLPATFWRGAAAIGLVGGIIGLLVAVLLQGLGAPAIPGESYGWYKGLYGGLLPVLLQPSMTYAILRNTAATPVSGSRPAC
jgi:hypothetical protein